MFYVLFLIDGKIVHTEHYDSPREAFGDAESHVDRGSCDSREFDALVFRIVDGNPVNITRYERREIV